MNHQEAFDIALNGILSQGGPSQRGGTGARNTHCLYRGPEGRKCAIGWLIPDDEYQVHFEEGSLGDVYEACPSLDGLDDDILDRIQRAHDNAAIDAGRGQPQTDMAIFKENFLTLMQSVASDYDLTFTLPVSA